LLAYIGKKFRNVADDDGDDDGDDAGVIWLQGQPGQDGWTSSTCFLSYLPPHRRTRSTDWRLGQHRSVLGSTRKTCIQVLTTLPIAFGL